MSPHTSSSSDQILFTDFLKKKEDAQKETVNMRLVHRIWECRWSFWKA